VAQSKRFAPHFHMPLQSGNNKQLKAMRRRYQRELYAERVASIKKQIPHCCIGVDVIVGFPGETEDDFLETYRFINELDISYLHVFTYSERPNTPAATMSEVVPLAERRRRNEMLSILSQKKTRYFYEQQQGSTRPVLLEKSRQEGLLSGFTDNYVKVEIPLEESWVNHIVPAKLSHINAEGIMQIALPEIVE
jgi:threonylcarbamoyladenosine tRNA methylthiotransferase MtaB